MKTRQNKSMLPARTFGAGVLARTRTGTRLARILLLCVLVFVPALSANAITLWQNTNTTLVTANNSISCNLAGVHSNNSYWRSFTPFAFGQTGTFTVTGVRIGIEEAVAGTGNQPISVRIYTNSGGAFPGGTRTLIGTTNTTVSNTTLSFRDIAVTAPTQPGTTEIVVEIFTPDATATNDRFFIGSNSSGQTAPSYISAASCSAPSPFDVAMLGAPGMHTLIGLTGNGVVTAATASIAGNVRTAAGNGIRNAVVSLTMPNGEVRKTRTGAFGYYRFDELETGETYILSIEAKRFRFTNPTRVITLQDEITAEDFIGNE